MKTVNTFLHMFLPQGLARFKEAQEGREREGEGQAARAAQGGRPVHVAELGVAAGHRPRQADAVRVRGHALAGAGLGDGRVPQERVHCGHGAPA